jgi:quercetin dioxygenase-like cupin family protein
MGYPEFITRLPLADVPFPNVQGYMLRSADGLQVFFYFPEETVVPMHSHGAQWGIMVEGQMEFTVGEETKIYKAGDSYVIGAGQMHGGVIQAGTRLIDFFEEPERYKPRA